MSLYREKILDHYRNPRHFGEMEDADVSYHLDNPLCGDAVDIFIQVRNNKIEKVQFNAEGCAISIAATSMLLEQIKGVKIKDVQALTQESVTKMLGIPLTPSRFKCALLGLQAVHLSLMKIIKK